MMDLERIKQIIYNAIPSMLKDRIEREARYAKIDHPENITVSLYSILTALLGLFWAFYTGSTAAKIGVTVVSIPIIIFLPYFIFSLYADKRRKQIEEVLPDALNLISANIESGLTVDKAFLLSARDEFGPLAVDLREAAMEMFGGAPVNEALEDLSRQTNSELFQETLNLLQDGIEAGGKVSKLLASTANDVQKSLKLRDEIAANVKMYSLFIIMAAVIGAPVLFAVSVFLTSRTSSMWSSQSIDFDSLPSGSSPLTIQEPAFRPEFFADFAVAAIVISNLFAALLISEIKNGDIKNGIKYIPVYTSIALIIYFVASTAINLAL